MHDPQASKQDPSQGMEDRMHFILGMVNDWLKFAEAKNGAALTLSSAAIALIATRLLDRQDFGVGPLVLHGLALAFLTVNLGLTLISLLPQTDLAKRLSERHKEPLDSDNLYFFGDLAKYSPDLLLQRFCDLYAKTEQPREVVMQGQLAIAAQLVSNARITLWKLRLFSISVVFFVIAALLSVIAILWEVS